MVFDLNKEIHFSFETTFVVLAQSPGRLHRRGPEFDSAHPAGEVERADCFAQVVSCRPAVHQHERLAVATERVLQQGRQLGVPVWDVSLFGCTGSDDIGKRTQRLVDVLCFFASLPCRL